MKVALSALLLVTTFISHTAGVVHVHVTVTTTHAVSITDDLFVGVTLDSSLLPTPKHWGGLDLNSHKVRTLARGLSPCYLRIGGTAGDTLTFLPTGHGTVDSSRALTGATWDAANRFVQDVNWKLIFGLNVLKRKDGHWDPYNAQKLLEYTKAKGYHLAGLELGNEPDIFLGQHNITVSASQLGRDYYNFKKLLQSTPGYEKTPIFGPDMTSVTRSGKYLTDFLRAGGDKAVHGITFHHYYTNGHTAHLSDFTNTKLMDTLVSYIQSGIDVSRHTNPHTPLWLGETSSCHHGGAPGMSNRYVAGFLWLDKLGIAARMGLKGVLRQDFYAGTYGLIDHQTFDPLPDYWLTVLYKRLVEGAVLSVNTNHGNSTIRAYAHCTKRSTSYGYVPGSVTMYFLLPTDTTASINFPQFPGQHVDVFWLKPVDGLTGRKVSLNGRLLTLVNGQLPHLSPKTVTTGSVTVPGKSFGFIVIPHANAAACKSHAHVPIIG
ncbi:heparanase-like isoform X1 [Haliotis rubra]|uniref:heparanase-like isoform X1 n=1 Tax=Haliotis rubra TaxID=36100 RepID=UPI001EE55B8A|nr:heparanase-like isoform X1 [Haliotis rubra]